MEITDELIAAASILQSAINDVELDRADDLMEANETGERVDLHQYVVCIPLASAKVIEAALAPAPQPVVSPSPFGQHPDDVAVDRFAAAMKAKLARKRVDGASGWDDPEVCHIDYLAHLLREQFHSRAVLDLVDIGNFAMMIFNRGEAPCHGR